MTGPGRGCDAEVARELARHARGVRGGAGRWDVDLGNGTPLAARAAREEDWLLVAAPVVLPRDPDAPWRLLALNRRLPGAARLARGDPGGYALRADVILHEPEARAARVGAACRAIRDAARALEKADPPSPAAEKERLAAGAAEWKQLATELGWTVGEPAGGRTPVELDAPAATARAWASERGDGLRLRADLGPARGLSDPSRRATASYLLALTGWLRLVRATLDGTNALRLEVVLPAAPSALELDLGLSALSVACRMGSREARALAEERLARRYLDLNPTWEE